MGLKQTHCSKLFVEAELTTLEIVKQRKDPLNTALQNGTED